VAVAAATRQRKPFATVVRRSELVVVKLSPKRQVCIQRVRRNPKRHHALATPHREVFARQNGEAAHRQVFNNEYLPAARLTAFSWRD